MQLRRCTCGGIIVVPLFDVSPSIGVQMNQSVPRMLPAAKGSRSFRRRIGPSPNNRMQRAVNHKVHGARTRHAIGRPTCAQIAHSSAADAGR